MTDDRSLVVLLEGRRAGVITMNTQGRLALSYDEDYLSRLAAGALRKGTLTVYRISGRAGFVSYATGFTCPDSTTDMRIVIQGAGQANYSGFFDYYLAPSGDIRIGTSPTAAPGTYTAYIGCQTGGQIVKTYQFTQTVNSPTPTLGVSPAAARPGDRLTISAGTGCGAYTTSTQTADVAVFDAARGGKPIVKTTAAITTSGQWGPVTLLLPPGSGTAGWHVSATCQAARQTHLASPTCPTRPSPSQPPEPRRSHLPVVNGQVYGYLQRPAGEQFRAVSAAEINLYLDHVFPAQTSSDSAPGYAFRRLDRGTNLRPADRLQQQGHPPAAS